MSVPVSVDGQEHRRRFAALDKFGRLHLTQDIEKIELRVLDGIAEDLTLDRVYFGIEYILEKVCGLPA